MNCAHKVTALIPALAMTALALGTVFANSIAIADDTPPAESTPPNDGPNGRHHNPAWAACKKQADDQKLAPGDARKEFMRNCIKSAKSSTSAADG